MNFFKVDQCTITQYTTRRVSPTNALVDHHAPEKHKTNALPFHFLPQPAALIFCPFSRKEYWSIVQNS